jgi:hypothetical protein
MWKFQMLYTVCFDQVHHLYHISLTLLPLPSLLDTINGFLYIISMHIQVTYFDPLHTPIPSLFPLSLPLNSL